ncbi:helix-turn-helix domain-containing protein [Streptomyces chartreusis]|uniref:helix-turn-helix domain-containing protein n=1 Tax=Streptomyces chartreusis TaxID=1969 RepID=UPI0036AF0E0E
MNTAVHVPSRACYQRGCQLPECAREDYVYRKQLDLDHLQGRRRMVDATQARIHIERLQANNWTYAQIGNAGGVSESAVHAIAMGQSEARASTVLGILSAPVTARMEQTVDATGTRRRIQALMYIGHTGRTIGEHAGYSADWMRRIAAGWVRAVNLATAAAVKRAYRQLVARPGASSRTRAYARRHNWRGPLAWSDIDDPSCKPEASRRSRAKDGARAARIDPGRVAELTAAGRSTRQIADELGCHKRTVTRVRRRAEIGVAA